MALFLSKVLNPGCGYFGCAPMLLAWLLVAQLCGQRSKFLPCLRPALTFLKYCHELAPGH